MGHSSGSPVKVGGAENASSIGLFLTFEHVPGERLPFSGCRWMRNCSGNILQLIVVVNRHSGFPSPLAGTQMLLIAITYGTGRAVTRPILARFLSLAARLDGPGQRHAGQERTG